MSEQDKRAEAILYESRNLYWDGKKDAAVALIAAALAQARREGVQEGRGDGAEQFWEGVEAMRDGSAYLDAKAARLLAKEEG
jgi:hypothetical protein